MDEDATCYGSRHRRRPHCIRRVPSVQRKGHNTPSFRPMSIVATVAHLSYCWALVNICNWLQINGIYIGSFRYNAHFFQCSSSPLLKSYLLNHVEKGSTGRKRRLYIQCCGRHFSKVSWSKILRWDGIIKILFEDNFPKILFTYISWSQLQLYSRFLSILTTVSAYWTVCTFAQYQEGANFSTYVVGRLRNKKALSFRGLRPWPCDRQCLDSARGLHPRMAVSQL